MKQAHESSHQNNTTADEPGQSSLGSYLKVFDLIELDMDVFFQVHDATPLPLTLPLSPAWGRGEG
jgi:hypothetical protein